MTARAFALIKPLARIGGHGRCFFMAALWSSESRF